MHHYEYSMLEPQNEIFSKINNFIFKEVKKDPLNSQFFGEKNPFEKTDTTQAKKDLSSVIDQRFIEKNPFEKTDTE